MSDQEIFEILINGPGPYGFRLYGGEGDPLIIAKLRARSKAHDAGLREGDIVLGINSRSCQTISHGIAMALLESAEESLHLHLYRGSTDRAYINSAYESVGHQLRPVSPGTVPPNRSIFSIQPTPPAPSDAQPSVPQPLPQETPAGSEIRNESAGDSVTSYSRQEATSFEDGVAQRVTTETETRDLGGVTLTKVTRHVETEGVTVHAADEEEPHDRQSAVVQKATLFHVPKFKSHPSKWTPEGSTAETGKPADRLYKAITVDLSPEGKENVTPNRGGRVPEDPKRFKIYKTTAKPWIWQPGYVPSLPVREPSPTMGFQILEIQEHPENGITKAHEQDDRRDEHITKRTTKDSYNLAPDLIRVLTTEAPEEDQAFKTKKKIFADSSFYDDPEQKYPTIEQQIKMARKVALSLSAPDNITARGQRMFMKRKEKANLWSTDVSFEGIPLASTLPRARQPRTNEPVDLYYNPTPWKSPGSKKIEKIVENHHIEGYSEDLAASSEAFAKNRARFERGVGYKPFRPAHYDRSGRKVPATGTLAPQACVGLVDDLKGMRGKGASMFAKRRVKAAEEEEEEWQSEPERDILAREKSVEGGHDTPDPNQPQASASRLEELISISKAYLSPWESGASLRVYEESWQPKTRTKASENEEDGRKWKPLAYDLGKPIDNTNQQTTSFLGKPSTGVYRPVKFQLFSETVGAGVSDF